MTEDDEILRYKELMAEKETKPRIIYIWIALEFLREKTMTLSSDKGIIKKYIAEIWHFLSMCTIVTSSEQMNRVSYFRIVE